MSILKNLNYIQEINRIPCAAPGPIIMIKTALQAAPPALINLVSPDCETAAEAALDKKRSIRPRPGGSGIGHRRFKGTPKWMQRGESVGGRSFLYRMAYKPAQRFLWWWLVADVTVEFIATWMSLVYQEQQCELPGAGTAEFKTDGVIVPAGTTNDLPCQTVVAKPGVIFTLTGFIIKAGFEGTVVYWSDWYRWPTSIPTDTQVVVFIVRKSDGYTMAQTRANDPAAQNGRRTGLSFSFQHKSIITDETYEVFATNPGSHHVWSLFSHGYVSLFGRELGSVAVGCAREFVTGADGYVLKPGPKWPFPPLGVL